MNRIVTLLLIEIRVYLRNGMAVFWTFLNPIVTLVVLMLMFGPGNRAQQVTLDVAGLGEVRAASPGLANAIERGLTDSGFFRVTLNDSTPEDRSNVAVRFQVDAPPNAPVTIGLLHEYGDNASASLVDIIVRAAVNQGNTDAAAAPPFVFARLATPAERTAPPPAHAGYTEYLIVGILVMSIASICLFGFTVPLVEMRSTGAGRMYSVFPLSISEFMAAFIASRLAIVVVFSTVLIVFGIVVYKAAFPIASLNFWLGLLALTIVGGGAFISVGLLLSSFAKTIATATALINMLYLPLMFFSDIFMPLDLLPDQAASILRALPLAQFVSGIRAVLIDGHSLAAAAASLASFVICAVLALAVTRYTFKWV